MIRRRLNRSKPIGLSVANDTRIHENLQVYMELVYPVRRVQEIRWFYDLAETENSILYTELDITDLLERVSEHFNGPPDD